MFKLIDKWMFRPVDASSLAVFRILFGGLILFESVNYGVFLCLDCMYRETDFLFKYHYFEWARLPPGHGLEWLFLVMGIAAVCVMLGFYYRLAIIVLTVTFIWHFLIDQALYLNHFYLAILFLVILIFLPAHKTWSLDARRNPEWASSLIPNWSRLWLGAQLEIVLLYAGFVKLNMDWLQLEPMRLWMNARSQDAAPIFQWMTQDWGIALSSYGVIALHLIGAPLLLWKRTRLFVFVVYTVFHIINTFVFDIGIFPWMTLAATLLLFDPDWPRQVLRWWNKRSRALNALEVASHSPSSASCLRPTFSRLKVAVAAAILTWLTLQLLVPLRHFYAPGNVAWNEDGHRFSWRMKLRSKRGWARFYVVAADGMREVIDPADHLNAKQVRKMACIPDLIWQFAGYLESQYSRPGSLDVKVYADTSCSLNTREPAPLIDRLVDLTAIPRDEPASNWVLPLSTPLPQNVF
ncbi:MAG: HTTM domain-containing protein [Granulosicoccus sp.]